MLGIRGLVCRGLEQQALETGISLHRGPDENYGGVRSHGTLRESWRALETGHLSIWAQCEGHLEGGSFTGDLDGYVKEGSGDGHLLP